MAKRKSALVPTAEPAPEDRARILVNEEKAARAQRVGEAIRNILDVESCVMTVPTLNISTGRVLPQIEVLAKDLPPKA